MEPGRGGARVVLLEVRPASLCACHLSFSSTRSIYISTAIHIIYMVNRYLSRACAEGGGHGRSSPGTEGDQKVTTPRSNSELLLR
jgi:hypothetical protein